VVAKRVTKERIISLTDPDARHGRKSKSKTFNGYKLHLVGDIVSGLITAVAVTPGNRHDNSVAHRLIRRAKVLYQDIDIVLGDTAYSSAQLRHQSKRELGVELVAPPSPDRTKRTGQLGKYDFEVDLTAMTARCPAGVTANRHQLVFWAQHESRVNCFAWNKEDCLSCPLIVKCQGNRRGGMRLRLHPYEQELRQARQVWEEPEVRQLYRKRSQCERLVNQMTRHGARRARGWGLASAQLQAHLIAMRCNLQLLAKAMAERQC
jgi:hypothetical protein